MNETGFKLTVLYVKRLNEFSTAVCVVVADRSISVNDYVCLDSANRKKIKAYVTGISVAENLDISTAEPGTTVWLVLYGRRAAQIKRGDILKPPVKGRLRHSTTLELLAAIAWILLIANLINIAVCLPLGWKDNISDVLLHSLIVGSINIFMLLAVQLWEVLSRLHWKQTQKRDDLDTDFLVLKCSSSAYQLLILPAALTIITGVFFYQWSVSDPLELRALWEKGELNQELLILSGLNLLLIGSFVQLAWRKVFYSRRLLRVVRFGIVCDIPWRKVRSIILFQDNSHSRMILETGEKKIDLRSDILSDGWGDFVVFALETAEKYSIPYKLQKVDNVKRIRQSEKRKKKKTGRID